MKLLIITTHALVGIGLECKPCISACAKLLAACQPHATKFSLIVPAHLLVAGKFVPNFHPYVQALYDSWPACYENSKPESEEALLVSLTGCQGAHEPFQESCDKLWAFHMTCMSRSRQNSPACASKLTAARISSWLQLPSSLHAAVWGCHRLLTWTAGTFNILGCHCSFLPTAGSSSFPTV